MANKLNVLVGAILDSNVAKDLNKELDKLQLDKIEVGLTFNEETVGQLKSTIKSALKTLFNSVSFADNEAAEIGRDIGNGIATGLQQSKKQIKRHLNDVVKDSEKAANKITQKFSKAYFIDDVGNQKTSSKTVETDYGDGTKRLETTRWKYRKNGSIDVKQSFLEVDNSQKLAAKEAEKAAREAEKAAKKAEEAEQKRQNEIVKSKKIYKELQKAFKVAQQKYADARMMNPEMDLSKEEKELMSLGGALNRYKQMLKEVGKETQWFTDLQKKMSMKLKSASALGTGIDKETEKYQKEVQKQRDIDEAEYIKAEKAKESYLAASQAKIRSEYVKTEKVVSSLSNVNAENLSSEETAKLINKTKQYRKELDEIVVVMNKENAEADELIVATTRLVELQRKANLTANEFVSAGNIHAKLNAFNEQTEREITTLKSQYGSSFDETKYRKIRDLQGEINKIIKEQGYNEEAVNNAIRRLISNSKTFTTNLRASSKELKEIRDKADLLDSSLGRFIQFYGFGELFRGLKTAFRDIVTNIKEIDSSMLELKKVGEETDYVYDRFLDNAADKAKELGTSLKDYIDSVTEFARMGYDFEESQVVAETANIMQMVSEGLTGEQSAQYLISIMAAYGIEAERTMDIIDQLNNVDRRSQSEMSGQTLSFYRRTSRDGRPIPRIRLFYVMCA